MSKFKNMLLAAIGLLLLSNVLLLTQRNPAQAQSPGVNLAQLVAQVNALKSQQTSDEQTITNQGNTITSQGSQITNLQNLSNGQAAEITDLNAVIDNQSSQITLLQTKTAPLSLSSDPNAGGTNTLLTIKGVNVQIVSGSGYTDDGTGGEVKGAKLTGLGNLILGYNATGNFQGKGDIRTGSHNLILGDQNNYESYGGLIAGSENTVSGPYASVSGGTGNAASGYAASVSGGYSNAASNDYASVSGGVGNTASGYIASVSGGSNNTAGGNVTSISGGYNIIQYSGFSWSGGSYHSP